MFIVNVEAAIYDHEKWLLVLRSKKEEHAGGSLSLVGGKVDTEGNSTEILERTLQREVFEEVGVEIQNLNYVNSSSFVTETGLHVVDIVFQCELKAGEAFVKSPEEVDEVVWLSTSEIVNHLDIPEYLKENIKEAEKVRKKVYRC
ncbi:NUDIX domain-containing protein [Neobacillus sp. D3-1R]|uniref:NUDIX domain-containing protein n=1 Tax=Neobacillus sp. D3-1R TaxID=3445778 RepID=UPI003F9FB325